MKNKPKPLRPREVFVMALAGAITLAGFAAYKIFRDGEIGASGIFGMTMGGLTVIGIIVMTARERRKRMNASLKP